MPAPASEAAVHLRNGRSAERVLCGCGREYFFIRSYTESDSGSFAPCPRCGLVTPAMVAEARASVSFFFWIVALVLVLLCVPFFFLGIYPEAMQLGWDAVYQARSWKFYTLGVGVGLTFLCCLLALATPWLYDPNRFGVVRRIMHGERYCLLPEQLEEARMRATQPITLPAEKIADWTTFYASWNGRAVFMSILGAGLFVGGLGSILDPTSSKMYIGALIVGPILFFNNIWNVREV